MKIIIALLVALLASPNCLAADVDLALDAQNIGSNGMFAPTIVINGRVVGTWKRALKKDTVVVSLIPFTSFSQAERNAIAAGAKLFSKFVGRSTTVFE